MALSLQHKVDVAESSQVGEARRLAIDLARAQGFAEEEMGRVAIAVSEAATNLVKHAGGGQVILRELERKGTRGVGFLAIDRGPGIPNVGAAVKDGFSTRGTSGTGLGAIVRQCELFDVYSSGGAGTTVLAQFWADGSNRDPERFAIGAVSLACPGELVCGDGWDVAQQNGRIIMLVTDGLGHGVGAAEASEQAVAIFRRHVQQRPAEIVQRMHEAMRATRGAAVAVAEIHPGRRVVRFAGVGNIAGTLIADERTRSMVSHHGTVGHDVRKIAEFEYPWRAGDTIVMHSDGIVSHWTLERYPGLLARHPAIVAGVLYRDFRRSRDDVTVLVAREAA